MKIFCLKLYYYHALGRQLIHFLLSSYISDIIELIKTCLVVVESTKHKYFNVNIFSVSKLPPNRNFTFKKVFLKKNTKKYFSTHQSYRADSF